MDSRSSVQDGLNLVFEMVKEYYRHDIIKEEVINKIALLEEDVYIKIYLYTDTLLALAQLSYFSEKIENIPSLNNLYNIVSKVVTNETFVYQEEVTFYLPTSGRAGILLYQQHEKKSRV